MERVILASRSPRRRELLGHLFQDFECLAADINETPRPDESPESFARRMALEKATAIAQSHGSDDRDRLIIGADTVIDLDGRILGKPGDADEATAMLQRLANRSHRVMTGFALLFFSAGGDRRATRERVAAPITTVTFDALPDAAVADYVATGIPFDRAGGYGIQDAFGARFIRRIDGDYNNVVGLPVNAIRRALAGGPDF